MNDSSATAAMALVERLALSADPFAGVNDAFFFVGGQRRFLVQQAVHALYFARGMVLLSGVDGCGKTRIVDEVCRELAELADVCRLDASVLMDARQIRQHLASGLGLSIDAADTEETLLAALDQMKPDEADPLPVLLAVDDAQQLAIEALTDCHHLALASRGRVRLLLAGAPELLTAWEQAGRFEADQLDVPPLDAQESADYVSTCLQAAGYRGENILDDDALNALYKQTRGNIGAINAAAPLLLMESLGGELSTPMHKRLPVPHVAAIALLVLVVVGAAFFLRRSEPSEPEHVDAPVSSAAAPATADRQSIPLAIPQTVPAGSALPESSAVAPAPQASAPETTMLPAQPEASKPVATTPVVPKPTTVKTAPVKPAPVKPVPVKPPHQPAAAGTAATGAGTAPLQAAELQALPSDQFVLQIVAVSDRPKLDAFLVRAAQGIKVYTYETRRAGKPWFVAVTGPYADKGEARAAIPRLPQTLRDQKPWLRSVASVKADLASVK